MKNTKIFLNRNLSDKLKMFKFKICLFLFIATVYLLFASGTYWYEANYQLKVAKNLSRNLSLSTSESTTEVDVKGRNGRWYDPHGITNVFLLLSVAALEPLIDNFISDSKDLDQAISFLGALTGIVINTSMCLVFFSMLFLFKRPLKICFYSTLCLAFLTIVFPYTSTNYEGNLNMLFILSSLFFLFVFQEKQRTSFLVYSGFFAGLAINTREFSFIFLLCILLYIIWLSREIKTIKVILVFLIAISPFLVLWGYYNWLRTNVVFLTPISVGLLSGRWIKFSPYHNIISGLKGLLLSKGGSIFIYSPILILTILSWREFFRSKQNECILLLSIVIFFLLANAQLSEWFGLYCWGPRYTLEITPLLMLPLGYWFDEKGFRNKIKKKLFITITALSLLIQLSGVLTNWHGRLGYLLKNNLNNAFLYTIKYSQWWDSVKTLFINLWNLFFGSFLFLENPGHSSSGPNVSLYVSTTLYTWWNRLIFMGINPWWILMYFALSLIIIRISLTYMLNFIRKEN